MDNFSIIILIFIIIVLCFFKQDYFKENFKCDPGSIVMSHKLNLGCSGKDEGGISSFLKGLLPNINFCLGVGRKNCSHYDTTDEINTMPMQTLRELEKKGVDINSLRKEVKDIQNAKKELQKKEEELARIKNQKTPVEIEEENNNIKKRIDHLKKIQKMEKDKMNGYITEISTEVDNPKKNCLVNRRLNQLEKEKVEFDNYIQSEIDRESRKLDINHIPSSPNVPNIVENKCEVGGDEDEDEDEEKKEDKCKRVGYLNNQTEYMDESGKLRFRNDKDNYISADNPMKFCNGEATIENGRLVLKSIDDDGNISYNWRSHPRPGYKYAWHGLGYFLYCKELPLDRSDMFNKCWGNYGGGHSARIKISATQMAMQNDNFKTAFSQDQLV